MGENVSRTIIKNILKGRTCSNCARTNNWDYKHCNALMTGDKNTMICSQWMMDRFEKTKKLNNHREKVIAKRKQKRLNVKDSITQENTI